MDQADATGLSYRRNRYYDPVSGQFTQQDPIGIAGGLNLYGYANGDPINFSDPFGLNPCLVPPVAIGCAIVAGLFVSSAYLTAQISTGPERATGLLNAGANAAASIGSRLRKLGEIITIGVSGVFGPTTPPKTDQLLNPETTIESPAPSPKRKPKDEDELPVGDDPPPGGR
jgi:RHS repeat-associated protein